jgi:soluble lytic murein transglycosylase-like protein
VSLATTLARIDELVGVPQQTAPAQTAPATGAPTFQQALTNASAGSGSTPFAAEIQRAAAANGIDPSLLTAVIQQESGFDPNATSAAGAEGLMQLMPQTAAGLGVTNPYDPVQSIDAGARYLKGQLDRFGSPALALAAYNAGPVAVERYRGVPPYPETQNYVNEVLARAQRLQRGGAV